MADQPEYRIRPGGPHLYLKVGCTPEQLARLAAEKKAAEKAAQDKKKPPEAP